jgi:hypothetical protein
MERKIAIAKILSALNYIVNVLQVENTVRTVIAMDAATILKMSQFVKKLLQLFLKEIQMLSDQRLQIFHHSHHRLTKIIVKLFSTKVHFH